jgi:hypothetical protein
VGLAALQIVKMTRLISEWPETTQKRRFLSALGAHHVFYSRSLDFMLQVLSVT